MIKFLTDGYFLARLMLIYFPPVLLTNCINNLYSQRLFNSFASSSHALRGNV